jgi:hypothetical protein
MMIMMMILMMANLAVLVVRIGESRGAYRVLLGNLRENDLLEELDIDGRIISECSVKKSVGRTWTRLIWLIIDTSGGLF